MNMEKVIKELHDARRYLEDKEWSDRGASPHIDAINDALALLKEQEAKTITNKWHKNPLGDYSRLHCPWCDRELDIQSAKEYVACPYCGRAVKWE